MATAITVLKLPALKMLMRRTTCRQRDIGPAFTAALHLVDECCKEVGATIKSEPIAVYLQWLDTECEIAVGYTVEVGVIPAAGCEWLDVPGGAYAVAQHVGGYESLQQTHTAIIGWCNSNGRAIVGPCWESYAIGPGAEPDASKWQTYVHYPVET